MGLKCKLQEEGSFPFQEEKALRASCVGLEKAGARGVGGTRPARRWSLGRAGGSRLAKRLGAGLEGRLRIPSDSPLILLLYGAYRGLHLLT